MARILSVTILVRLVKQDFEFRKGIVTVCYYPIDGAMQLTYRCTLAVFLGHDMIPRFSHFYECAFHQGIVVERHYGIIFADCLCPFYYRLKIGCGVFFKNNITKCIFKTLKPILDM